MSDQISGDILQQLRHIMQLKEDLEQLEAEFCENVSKPATLEITIKGVAIVAQLKPVIKAGLELVLTGAIRSYIYETEQYGFWNLEIGQTIWLTRMHIDQNGDSLLNFVTQGHGAFYAHINVGDFLAAVPLTPDDQSATMGE